jgi:hypothetical protein
MIFYSIFWSVYAPIALLILWLIADTAALPSIVIPAIETDRRKP